MKSLDRNYKKGPYFKMDAKMWIMLCNNNIVEINWDQHLFPACEASLKMFFFLRGELLSGDSRGYNYSCKNKI